MNYPDDTPRTNAVLKTCEDLSWGSVVQIPPRHPPSDPWELARTLERELITITSTSMKLKDALQAQFDVQSKIFTLLNYWVSGEYMKEYVRVDPESIIAQVYGDLAAEYNGLKEALAIVE